MKLLILLIIISLLLCYHTQTKQVENFKPFRIFYNKKHKYARRKIRPHMDKIKQHFNRFYKKFF